MDIDPNTVTTTPTPDFVETVTQPTQPAPPPADLSPRMVQLARQIDHLATGGEYIINLTKGPQEWDVTIVAVEGRRKMRFWR